MFHKIANLPSCLLKTATTTVFVIETLLPTHNRNDGHKRSSATFDPVTLEIAFWSAALSAEINIDLFILSIKITWIWIASQLCIHCFEIEIDEASLNISHRTT